MISPVAQTPLLQWQGLGLEGLDAASAAALAPGLTLLVDPQDAVLHRLLPLLAGRSRLPPGGQLHCAGLDSGRDGTRYAREVFWQNPRAPMDDALRQQTAQSWVHAQARRWPQWSESAWHRHLQGWGLEAHLHKQLWQLSTGTLRKLWMASALASGAGVTLLEEPLAGLDAESIRYLVNALQTVQQELHASATPRWVLVAHYEPMPRVCWDGVLPLSED